MDYPKLYRISQVWEREGIKDIGAYLHKELKVKGMDNKIQAGSRIAITVGSRGIANLKEIVTFIVEWVKQLGANPVIIPSMGSHGNATAAGQRQLLEEYGITEKETGAPVLSSMDVVRLGQTSGGAPVYIDKNAYESDGIVVLNRVKPHTTMRGIVQSGLMKMMAVGLGKQKGAESMHKHGLEESIPESAKIIIQRGTIVFGLAIIENAYEETSKIIAVPPEEIEAKEKELLKEAEANLPVIPFDPLDVLIVNWMGKNISGSGMDTNVVGRWRRIGGPPDKNISRIAALHLTPESHGNAIGLGMAEIITREIYENIDFKATYMNGITAGWLGGVRVPMFLDTEREVFQEALRPFDPDRVRMVLINSTLQIESFLASGALLPEARQNSNLRVVEGPLELRFDTRGRLEGMLW